MRVTCIPGLAVYDAFDNRRSVALGKARGDLSFLLRRKRLLVLLNLLQLGRLQKNVYD